MDTTIIYSGSTGGYIGILEKEMETTSFGFKV